MYTFEAHMGHMEKVHVKSFSERNPVCTLYSEVKKEFITPNSETVALNVENDTELFQGHSKERQHQSAKSNRR